MSTKIPSTPLRSIAWMAWRSMKSKQKKSGLSFMTLVSILGVAIGVAAIIIVLSVMGGFENDLRNRLLKGEPHLEISAKIAAVGFSLLEHPVSKFKEIFPEAYDVQPFTQSDVVVKQGKHLASVTLFGVDGQRDDHLWGFGTAMVEGDLKDVGKDHLPIVSWQEDAPRYPGIVLGSGLALQLSAQVGDEIIVISPQGATDTSAALSGGTLSRTFVLVGTFQTDLFNYDNKWAVVDLSQGRKFLADYDESLDEELYVSGIAMNFKDPYIVESFEPRRAKLQELSMVNWQNSNKSLLFALKLEKFAMGSILMLIVVVASFSISGTMMMTVYHRRPQVSLYRSLGMTKGDVAKLFLVHGFGIGTIGILIGVLLGVSVCFLIHQLQFIQMPSSVYYLTKVPVKFLPSNYLVIALLAWVLSLIAAAYPAFTAARQDPVSGLKI